MVLFKILIIPEYIYSILDLDPSSVLTTTLTQLLFLKNNFCGEIFPREIIGPFPKINSKVLCGRTS